MAQYDPSAAITSAKAVIIEYLQTLIPWVKFLPDHPRGTLPSPLLMPHVSLGQGQVIPKSVSMGGDYLGEQYDEELEQIRERRGKLVLIKYPIDIWVGLGTAKGGGPVARDRVVEALMLHLDLNSDVLRARGVKPMRFFVGRSQEESSEQSEDDSTLELLKTQCKFEVEVMMYVDQLHDVIEGIDIQASPRE